MAAEQCVPLTDKEVVVIPTKSVPQGISALLCLEPEESEESVIEAMSGKLYLVGTPIGNLGDFSPRAAETLRQADFIAAEDTRVTLKLLNHFDIRKPLVSYYEHNKFASGEKIFQRIAAGEKCALVTDAGMPAISDPGEDIVRLCAENGVAVETVPGPAALVSALALSGLPAGRFTFEGFLSVTAKTRRAHLESLRGEARTMAMKSCPSTLAPGMAAYRQPAQSSRLSLVTPVTVPPAAPDSVPPTMAAISPTVIPIIDISPCTRPHPAPRRYRRIMCGYRCPWSRPREAHSPPHPDR